MAAPKGFLVVPVGFRNDGTLRALELTDDDKLKVQVSSSVLNNLLTELEAKLETADLELVSKILSIGSHGWVGGAWQRNPLQFGFSAVDGENFSNVATGTAGVGHNGTPVPAGEIWILQTAYLTNSLRAQVGHLEPSIGGAYNMIVDGTTAGAWRGLIWTGRLIMEEGDLVRAYFRSGHQSGDSLVCQYSYVRVDIDQ